MKNMKKVLSLLIVLIMSAAIAVTGCTKNDDKDSKKETKKPEVTAEVKETEKPDAKDDATQTPDETQAPEKDESKIYIKFVVKDKDGNEKTFDLSAPKKEDGDVMLVDALTSQEGLVAGSESEYGLFVDTIDGYKADSDKQEWWCFTKGGESLMTGVSSTPIKDGDTFEATLTVGW